MENNYDVFMNPDTDCMFINLKGEEYTNIWAKVGNVEIDDKGEISFEVEMAETQKEYESNDEFLSKIGEAVADIITKSVRAAWGESERAIMTDIEQKVAKMLEPYKIEIPEGSSYVEMFGNKNYVLTEDDDDRLVAIDIKTENKYYFDRAEELAFLKREITGVGIIL